MHTGWLSVPHTCSHTLREHASKGHRRMAGTLLTQLTSSTLQACTVCELHLADTAWHASMGHAESANGTLQAEENALRAGRTRVMDGSGAMPSWNHAEFRVRYASLARQLSVSGIYVKLLLDGLDQVQLVPPTSLSGLGSML